MNRNSMMFPSLTSIIFLQSEAIQPAFTAYQILNMIRLL